MRIRIVAGSLLALGAMVVFAQEARPRTVWDGVYTAQQAQRGKSTFAAKCTYCHGENLEGDAGGSPALSGTDFLWQWNDTTLDQLFERIHHDMPFNNPGTLKRETAAELLAYILSFNQFPTGHSELSSDPQVLMQIKMEAEKPKQ